MCRKMTMNVNERMDIRAHIKVLVTTFIRTCMTVSQWTNRSSSLNCHGILRLNASTEYLDSFYLSQTSASASNAFFRSLAYLLYVMITQVLLKIPLFLRPLLNLYSLLVLIFVLINFCTTIHFWTCVICSIMLQTDLKKLFRQFQ